MKIVRARPPNFAEIVAVFPGAAGRDVLFTYGDTIYTLTLNDIPASLLAHEEVHSQQQGAHVEQWWRDYLTIPVFRYAQELEAHRVEYATAIVGLGRGERRAALSAIAKRLSGPLYGRMVSLNKAKEALQL